MRKIFLMAVVVTTVFSPPAHAGFFRELAHEAGLTGVEVAADAAIDALNRPAVSGGPMYYPASPVYSPYAAWMLPRLPQGAVLYNRPCTFSDGITTSAVPCPGTLISPAVYQPIVEQPALNFINAGYAYVGGGRYYRHVSRPANRGTHGHFSGQQLELGSRAWTGVRVAPGRH